MNFLRPKFERVTYKAADGQTKTVLLKISRETDAHLFGYQVNREGQEKDLIRNLHVMSTKDIVKRVKLVLDKKYAHLVQKGTETK